MPLPKLVLWLVHNPRSKWSIVKSSSNCESKLVFKNCKSISKILIASSSPSSKPAKGLSSSELALAAASSKIPNLRKQLVKVLSGSVFHPFESYILAERIDTAGIEAFFSKLDINLLTTNERYFAFNKRIIPWSMGCVTEVALSGRKINSTHSRCLTCDQGTIRSLKAKYRSFIYLNKRNK